MQVVIKNAYYISTGISFGISKEYHVLVSLREVVLFNFEIKACYVSKQLNLCLHCMFKSFILLDAFSGNT